MGEKLSLNLKSTKFNITIKEIPISKIDSTIDLVVNPFGEIFPTDNSNIGILNLILNFISTGGTFVNLGGLPFWASRNVQTGKGKAYIIPEFNVINGQIFKSLPLKNTLSWQMFGIITTGDTKISIKR